MVYGVLMKPDFLQKYSRVIVVVGFSLMWFGLLSYFVMPSQEDPTIRNRNAVATLVYPGAGPEKIERLVLRPIEDALGSVSGLKEVESEARLNVAILKLRLRDDVHEISETWREVERALEEAQGQLPKEVNRPLLDFHVLDVESVVIAVTGSDNLVELRNASLTLKDALLKLPNVARVKLFGDPGPEVAITVNPEAMNRHGISAGQLYSVLKSNNSATPTGFIVDRNQRIVLEQDNDARNIDQLRRLRFETGKLEELELSSFARVDLTTQNPPQAIFRWNGRPAIGLGIVAKEAINIVAFGDRIRKDLSTLENSIKPLKIEMVAFQPKRTQDRLRDLLWSLLTGIILIVAFLSWTMGARTAFVIGFSVPAISLIGLFAYFLMGGVIHQISIAAFVISIGQFIDNIIVIVDSMKRKMSHGISLIEAAEGVSKELQRPMLFATLTGICAFLPMLASEGSTADFVFSLPLVAVLTLIVSYFFAIFFAPLLAAHTLEPEQREVKLPLAQLEKLVSSLAVGPIRRIGLLVLLILAVSIASWIGVKKEFFPESDRNEFLLTFNLSPASDIHGTLAVLKFAEERLRELPEVTQVAAFAGGGIPRFYYNLPNPLRAPQSGQLLVTTKNSKDVKGVGLKMEELLTLKFPQVKNVAHFLQQGPPINAKVEVQVFSDSNERRQALIQKVEQLFRSEKGLRGIRTDLDEPLQVLRLKMNEEKMAQAGLSREEVNLALALHSSGVEVTQFRSGRELVPVRLKTLTHVQTTEKELGRVLVKRGRDRDYRVQELIRSDREPESPLIRRLNSTPFSRALADLTPGYSYDQALRALKPKLEAIPLIEGEKLAFAGDAKGAGEANASIFRIVPMAMLFLIIFLLLEFRSIRKVMIALTALPITVLGVFPGLYLGGAPFGFMSLLGLLALVGIAVNNIILLLEAMEDETSIQAAIASRFRAIFLTTTLTLLGLIPLALEDSSLWPPLAWTMISGLITGTFATLVVVPALYRLVFRDKNKLVPTGGLSLMLALLLIHLTHPAQASEKTWTIQEVIDRVHQTPESRASALAPRSAQELKKATDHSAFLPRLTMGGEFFQRNRDLTLTTPFGPLLTEESTRYQAQIELRQPLFNKMKMWNERDAQDKHLQSEIAHDTQNQRDLEFAAAAQSIEILILERQSRFMTDSVELLTTRRRDVARAIEKGRLGRSDLVKLDLAMERLKQQQEEVGTRIRNLKSELAERLGMDGLISLQSPPGVSPNGIRDLEKIESPALKAKALEAEAESIAAQARGTQTSFIPSVDGFARALSVEGRRLNEKLWGEVGLSMSWEIFGGGARGPQGRALALKEESLRLQSLGLRRTQKLEEAEALRNLRDRMSWKARVESLYPQAKLVAENEARRYFEGRGNLNDLVEADSVELELERDKDLSALEASMACYRVMALKGLKVNERCQNEVQ